MSGQKKPYPIEWCTIENEEGTVPQYFCFGWPPDTINDMEHQDRDNVLDIEEGLRQRRLKADREARFFALIAALLLVFMLRCFAVGLYNFIIGGQHGTIQGERTTPSTGKR